MGTQDPAVAADPLALPQTRAMEVVVYNPASGAPQARGSVLLRDPSAPADAPVPNGVAASLDLPWDQTAVAVNVYGEPGFYHLSFPKTQAAQNQEGESGEEGEQGEQGEEGEQQQADAQDPQDPQDPQEQEGAEPEEQPTPEQQAAQEAEAQEAQPTEEEAQQRALMQLLDSLEDEDVNLPLQQALQGMPPTRMRNEW